MCIFDGLVVLTLLAAQVGVPTDAEVRGRAREALEPFCRGRCDVLDVDVRTRPVGVSGAIAPGFDNPAEGRREVAEIRLTVLFDETLGRPFRTFAIERVKSRVGELGAPVTVTPRVRPFPTPAPPLEAMAPSPPPPSFTPAPPPPAKAPETPEVEEHRPRWVDLAFVRGLEFLPILLLFALLAAVLFRVLRRLEDLMFDLRAPPEPTPRIVTAEVVETDGGARPLPPPEATRLASDLRQHRSSTRRIFRRLLLEGEHDTVARAVALLGDGLVRDLAHDPEVRTALLDAGRRTAEVLRAPMTDEARDELLRTVQAELVADRVAHRSEDVRPELEPLLGWSPEAFVRFFDDLESPRLRHVALRHAPAHLTEPFLKGLAEEERATLVRSLVEAAPTEPEELVTLTERVRDRAARAEVGGWEADHLPDLVDALPAEAQEHVLARLEVARPDYFRRQAGSFPVESALLRVSDDALAAAWAEVSLSVWIAYLRSAPDAVRERALSVCPPRVSDAVREELSLRVPFDADAARSARRRVVSSALAAEGSRASSGWAISARWGAE